MKTTCIAILCFCSLSMFAQESVTLKLNLIKGNKYQVKTTSEQSINTSFNGMQQTSGIANVSYMSLVPLALGQKSISCEVAFDSISTKSNMSGMKMDINSSKGGNINSSNMSEVMSEIMARLSKSKLKVILSYEGKVIAINNITVVTDSVCKGLDSLKGQMAPMISMQVKLMVNEASLKGMIEANTAYLPSKPIKIGETWNTTYTQSSGGIGFTVATEYKLTAIKDKKAEVSGNATLEPAGTAPMEMNGAKISYDVRGLSKSTLFVDVTTGWLQRGSVKSHMKGNMNVSMNGNDMVIPVEIDNNSESTVIH